MHFSYESTYESEEFVCKVCHVYPMRTQSWLPFYRSSTDLSVDDFNKLISGDCPAIIIDNFLSPEECKNVSLRFEAQPNLLEYQQANVSTKYIGHSLVELANDPERYFAEVPNMFATVDLIYQKDDGTPLIPSHAAVIELLRSIWSPGVFIASENDASYFAGIIRAVKRSPLHNDFAPRDFPKWAIGDITQQFAWNLYLRSPASGDGKVVVYKRNWVPEDTRFKHQSADMMGYRYEIIKGVPSLALDPLEGRLVFFKTSNYHEVLESSGDITRISASSFIGMKDASSPLILWS